MCTPEDCNSIQDVRQQIDRIDGEIIKLIGERFGFVKAVVKYKKPTKDSIIAQERYDYVINKRRELAEQHGINPDVIEQMYRLLMNHFIEEELKLIANKNN